MKIADCVIVSEGANTMDIGRAVLNNELPRHRLDAGKNKYIAIFIFFSF
jgi:hypothetical protein